MRTKARPLQRGFAAIAAIFLIVMLAALGAFMVSISNTQQLNSALDLQGTRAYWAARAGLEWGLSSGVAGCPASPTTLSVVGFNVAVSCSLNQYVESGVTRNIYQFNSVASTGTVGSLGRVERSVSAQIEK